MAVKYSEYGTTVQPRKKKRPEDIPAQAITQPRVDGSTAGSPYLPKTTTTTPTYTPAVYPEMRVDTSKIVPLSERTGGAPMTPAAQQLQGVLLSGAVQKGWTTPERIASIAAASGEANPLAGLTMAQPTPAGGAGAAGAGTPTPGFPGSRAPAERLTEAQARAKMQIDLRREGLAAQQRQLAALAEQQRREQLSGLARMTEAQRYQFAGSNLGTSGFLAGAGAVAQGQTQENIGRINEAERAQLQAIEEQRAGLNRLEGDITTATLGELERGDFERRIREAESASLIAGREFERRRAEQLLPGELEAQRIGTLGAQTSQQMNALSLQKAQLEAEIMQNPDYGARAMAQRELEKVNADIARINRANIGGAGGGGGIGGEGFTPYQQWQIDKEILKMENEDHDRALNMVISPYNVSNMAGEIWLDLDKELATIQQQSGTIDREKAAQILQQALRTPGLAGNDLGWLAGMYAMRMGDPGAATSLRVYRKSYDPTKDPLSPQYEE